MNACRRQWCQSPAVGHRPFSLLISGPEDSLYHPGCKNRTLSNTEHSARAVVDVARQDLAFADMVGRADDALALHALDNAGSAVVADLQVALDEACAALALAGDQ